MKIVVDLANHVIETERLILRPWSLSDLDDFYEYARMPEVGPMAGWNPHTSKDGSQKILEMFINNKNDLAIVLKENNKAIGSLGVHQSWADEQEEFKELKVMELGYAMSKDYWGRGIMPEAVKAVIELCFDKFELDMLTIGHFDFNNQSRRVIEKCGFKYYKDGTYYSNQLDKQLEDKKYILLREDYELNRISLLKNEKR